MKTYLMVTITCPDRPGIVEHITEQVVRFSANWEDSRMARLGGDFAGIVKISVSQADADSLTRALLALADNDTTIAVKSTREDPAAPRAAHSMMDLQLTGADHEGIVHKVAAYLAGNGVNVESMDTSVSPAPMSGSPLFHMSAIIRVPAGLELSQFVASLTHIGEQLGVDINVRPHQP